VNRRLLAVATAALTLVALTGCSASDPLAEQYADGSGQGYVSGDGAQTELPVAQRGEPIEFAGPSSAGGDISSNDYAGQVYVVNFWYAGCPPCRDEAPDLAAVSAGYPDVPFLGINTMDSIDVATLFERKFEIDYPSIIDVNTASAQLAFATAGAVAPNAVPTTLVIDREGKVAARISGRIGAASILSSMIDTVLAETD